MRSLRFLVATLVLWMLFACDDGNSKNGNNQNNNNVNNTNNINNTNNTNNNNNNNNTNNTNPVCGNGILETGEDCDGTVGNATCETVGTFAGGTLACTSECRFDTSGCDPLCEHLNWETCEPLGANQCCPNNGMPSECKFISADAGAICMQTCETGDQCGYTLICFSRIGNLCFPQYCGGGANGTPLSQPCQLDAGRTGYCVGTGTAMDDTGICIEDGLAQHGEHCRQDPEDNPMGKILTEEQRRDICDGGVCVAMDAQGNPTTDGTCLQMCDPVATYEGVAANVDPDVPWTSTDTCPENSNCVNFSRIDMDETDSDGNPNPNYLFRTADMGICYPTVAGVVPGAGVTSCDLLSSRTIRTGEACPPMPIEMMGFPVTNLETTCQVLTDGSLIGACQPAETIENRVARGEVCDPAHERILFFVLPVPASQCAEGTLCLVADPLHAADMSTAETRCVKPCDARLGEENNSGCDGIIDSQGNPTICLSMSRYRSPTHELPQRNNPYTGELETETSPSSLGICVPAL